MMGVVRGVMALTLLTFLTVHAEWFPEMSLTEGEWTSALSHFSPSSSYTTCRGEHTSGPGGNTRFITLYKDHPMTFVLVGKGVGDIDVKFKDSNYVFEHSFTLSDTKYLVIPPYQPVEWILVRMGSQFTICSYSGTVDPSKEKDTKTSNCDCAAVVNSADSTFTSLPFPRTIRKPEQQFFLTAEITPDKNDVTICTILTVDRLLRLSQMSEKWGGPISAAVYLHDLSEISKVMEWYLANNTLRRYVDIHIVHDDKIVAFELPDRAFPVNILRNVAVRFARTASVFYIEGDFIPSPDLYPSLGEVRTRLAKGEKTVFIVAPFSSDNADFDMKLFPKDKQALISLMDKKGPIRDLSYFNSHSAFRFDEWYRSKSIYGMSFTGGYEPYYIGPKSYPLFEEIFIGCGADKVSHPSELNTAGYKFTVLPTGFIVHIDSTGMGSAWCRGWAGNARSTMKWEAFTIKTSHIYNDNKNKASFDSRIPWWDLAPAIAAKADDSDATCALPPKEKECPVCPACKECEKCEKCEECIKCPIAPGCPPPTKADCSRFTESYATDLSQFKSKMEKVEEANSKHKVETANFEATIRELRTENERLVEYSKFVVNLGIGVVVVMVVVVGLGVCIWPRSKKVWVLPTWKSTHHNL